MFSDNPRSGITLNPDCQDRHYGLCFSMRVIVRAFLDLDPGLAALNRSEELLSGRTKHLTRCRRSVGLFFFAL